MSATFIVVPQWQGSSSSRAMRLIDGAEAIRGDLPSAATRTVEIPAGAGESLETGIARFSSISAVADALDAALDDTVPGMTPVVVGGDCGVEYAAVRHAVAARSEPVAVVWFDAHPDIHSPETSPTGAFHDMVVRALLGEAPEQLTGGRRVVAPEHLVLAGTRAFDDAEAAYLGSTSIAVIDADGLGRGPQALVDAVRATGAGAVYIHVDLDVLDPAEISGITHPEPFGLSVAALTDAVRAVRAEFELVGAGITEFAPSAPDAVVDDLPAILRIVSALVR
ncbi:arginase family protein [Herbiconiux sp. A18JL235]|uniref:Arginase family protein n=1 Tax=Herbiconiux sp. A18JL235 TaxID=3152363 RepID=A0AB39BM38_9MICO